MPRFTVLNLLRLAGALVFLVTAYLIPRAIIPVAVIVAILGGMTALYHAFVCHSVCCVSNLLYRNWEVKDKLTAFGAILAVCTLIANQPTAKDYIASFGIQQPVQNAHATKTFTTDNKIQLSADFVCTHNTLIRPDVPCLYRSEYNKYNPLNRNGSKRPLVFGGAKGTGKSFQVRCMLQNVTGGVIHIRTNAHVQNQTPLSCQILKAMNFIEPPSADEDCMNALRGVLIKAAVCLDRKPILVVEAATTSSDVSEIYTPIRDITYEDQVACTTLVLSDALAAFSLKPNDRWELIFVDEFTEEEANQYLDNRKCLMGKANVTARETLLNTTMRGADLDTFVDSTTSVEEFTRELISRAGTTIVRLINVKNHEVPELSGPAFEKLVCMLLEDKYKDGVHEQITDKFALISLFSESTCVFFWSHIIAASLRRHRKLRQFSKKPMHFCTTCQLRNIASTPVPSAKLQRK